VPRSHDCAVQTELAWRSPPSTPVPRLLQRLSLAFGRLLPLLHLPHDLSLERLALQSRCGHKQAVRVRENQSWVRRAPKRSQRQ
jgi:hypothetical protein